jgi:hypothetical protein
VGSVVGMRKLIFDPSLIVGKDKDNYIWKYGNVIGYAIISG